MPPYSGKDAGEVKSAAAAGTLPTTGICAASRMGKYSPAFALTGPTTATTPSATAWLPHSRAAFGSLARLHSTSSMGEPSMPPKELIFSAAAVAPSGTSGVATAPVPS